MRVYLALGDATAEAWAREMLSSIEWVSNLAEADLAVVTRLSDVKAAIQSKIPVRLVAGILDAKARDMVDKARALGVRHVLAFREGERRATLHERLGENVV